MHHLIATQDFGPYKRGDRIEDDAEIARIQGGEHSVHVTRVIAPPKHEAASEAAPQANTALPPNTLAAKAD
ncbi:hypothetical protein [Bradyrhizobium sp.]|uniref:hypothetical protein n=1 Tax=Bradyrhizobium sp. TaxID=376 RepID=UPI001D5D27D2|nr:hypothetical protein [Bradyrhizobium sp.]MBV8697382.1 hypothetical protein [Bradyrhizobium sp.]MBV9984508.1 hypothetical protein [Bradyrhizobium sp.]